MSTRDRNFRPTRRHSFDDDNYQPPTRDFGFASRPSVLRFETPSGPPVRAIVKWYNPDKGFGFAEIADGSGDAFLHVSVVERCLIITVHALHLRVPTSCAARIKDDGPGAVLCQLSLDFPDQ